MSQKNWYSKIQEEFHKERNTEAFYKTKGFEKLWSAFKDLAKKESFVSEIKNIRKSHSIPEYGFELPNGTSSYPPIAWKYSNYSVASSKHKKEIREELNDLTIKYHFLSRDWEPTFEKYLFYNRPLLTLEPNSHNLCFVSDMSEEKDSLGRDVTDTELRAYPVTLHISPLASKNDIRNYVEKLYSTEIAPLQKKYRVGDEIIGKSRKKNPLTENVKNFIYENQDWDPQVLVKAVNKKFKTAYTRAEVTDTIRRENKKRK